MSHYNVTCPLSKIQRSQRFTCILYKIYYTNLHFVQKGNFDYLLCVNIMFDKDTKQGLMYWYMSL